MSLSAIPYKTFACYRTYLETAHGIINQYDKPSLCRIYAIQAIIIAYAANIMYSQRTQTPDDAYHAFVHADIAFYVFWPDFRFVILLNLALTSFMVHYQYVWLSDGVINFCIWIFFGETNESTGRLQTQVRGFAVKLLNCFQPFILVLDAVLLQFHVILSIEAWNHRRRLFFSWNGVLDLLFHLLNSVCLDVSFVIWANILIFCASLCVTLVYYLHQSINANLSYLKRCIRFGFGHKILTDFIGRESESLIQVRFVDRFTGPQMALFVLLNCPINAYLLMITVLGKLPQNPMSQLAVVLLVVEQMVGNFAFHSVYGQLSKQIYKSAKPLLSLAAAQAKMTNTGVRLAVRIRLALAVDRMHTRKRYGIHYGPCGLITLASFSKCLMVYGEFVMFAYKLIKNKLNN